MFFFVREQKTTLQTSSKSKQIRNIWFLVSKWNLPVQILYQCSGKWSFLSFCRKTVSKICDNRKSDDHNLDLDASKTRMKTVNEKCISANRQAVLWMRSESCHLVTFHKFCLYQWIRNNSYLCKTVGIKFSKLWYILGHSN